MSPKAPRTRTILVLGASGFLGAHLVAAVHERARRAEGRTRLVAAGRDVAQAPRFTHPRDAAEWIARDLAAPGSAAELVDELSPGWVVCCAALARMDDCERDPGRARRMNAELPGELAAACAARGARLVHVSTDLVFGAAPPPASGFRESDAPGPVSVYGETKAAGERAVLGALPAALVARLPLLYGDSGGRGLGASDSLLSAVDAEQVPVLFEDEWRTPLEVSNAAAALAELCAGDARGVLHVAGPDRVTRLELGLAVLRGMGLSEETARSCVRPGKQADVATHAKRPADVSLDAARARGLLSTPLLGVAAGVERALA